jgi:hypothetical protein
MRLVYLDLGFTTLGFILYGALPLSRSTEGALGYRMMALEVDDMQVTVEFLRTKGIDIVSRMRRAQIADLLAAGSATSGWVSGALPHKTASH